ncbi:hypothetical protein QCA50_012454 [Cerrena zonata]|uniref:Uncharacterized protein n=1 Tax=Cerrena zonata TaxID=2478898 RepID=A0AAW0G4K8_9APHY
MDCPPLLSEVVQVSTPHILYTALVNRSALKEIWDSLEPWFAVRRYILYPRDRILTEQLQPTGPLLQCPVEPTSGFPYAHVIDPTPYGRSFSVSSLSCSEQGTSRCTRQTSPHRRRRVMWPVSEEYSVS